MEGTITTIVGRPGEGKTTYIKTFSSGKKALCYCRIGSDFDDGKTIIFTDFIEFLDYANAENNIICYIDEAYTCLPKELRIKMGKPNDPHNKLADFLVNSRKMNRFVFIIFHGWFQIPTWLLQYTDIIGRFNTNDQMQVQVNRFISFPEIVASLKEYPTLPKYKPQKIKLR
jgi:hypothetical protein